ncbi:hypothetical protein GXW83_17385 [Streptacidiphilus sp. PB12-B1b]|uniref:hypothetical protein n=1 Tax=Streptacidiphilus sp. PB12-B1b TaxID=2705012 RepID=UPI0015FE3C08|nr:hypothetical protein [Streptacidiphilus sp. PB12-B1b]QMU77215.1 hypothetical protein GXW83_17385 [Streptacidiphilus sp. PB12-B1b]
MDAAARLIHDPDDLAVTLLAVLQGACSSRRPTATPVPSKLRSTHSSPSPPADQPQNPAHTEPTTLH